MKRTIILATAAAAMLTGCVKTEVNPVAVPEQEISYQAVVGPKTKAYNPDSHSLFNTKNQFVSFAYRIPSTWSWGNIEPEIYINGETIHYDSPDGTNGVWRPLSATNRYYWPEGYKLTFFAWSLNRNNVTVEGTTVGCDAKTGIKVENYDASTSGNRNADFMVAGRRTDETRNSNKEYVTEGVPTLFQHKLCQVRYAVRLNHAYSARTFALSKVELKNIVQKATYQQYSDYSTLADSWTLSADKQESFEYASSKQATNTLHPASNEEADNYGYRPLKTDWDNTTPDGSTGWNVSSDQYYFIPQSFGSDAKLVITYSITEGSNIDDVKSVTKERPLSMIFPEGWKKNTRYTINITIGLNEILWDPVEEKWAEEGSNDWSIVESQNN